jgi:hypothetical protein
VIGDTQYQKKSLWLAVQREMLDGKSVFHQTQKTESQWLTGARDGVRWANQKIHNVGYLTKGSGSVKAKGSLGGFVDLVQGYSGFGG